MEINTDITPFVTHKATPVHTEKVYLAALLISLENVSKWTFISIIDYLFSTDWGIGGNLHAFGITMVRCIYFQILWGGKKLFSY